jgi:hypothetical protein
MVSIVPAKIKTSILCSLIHTIFGKMEINVDKVAPAPKATNNAGMAQQMSVLELVKSVSKLVNKLPFGAIILSVII